MHGLCVAIYTASFFVLMQLLKKMTQASDACGFLSVVKILKDGDRTLLREHCQARAMTLLKNKQGKGYIKEAVTYLSFAITAAGKTNQLWASILTHMYKHSGQGCSWVAGRIVQKISSRSNLSLY